MKYQVTHRTVYRYSDEVSLCHNQTCLLPRIALGQQCLQSSLNVTPQPMTMAERIDFFGNRKNYFSLQTAHSELAVVMQSTVDVEPVATYPASPSWQQVRDQLNQDFSDEGLLARAFALDSPMIERSAELTDYAESSFTPQRPILDAALELTQRIYQDFDYDPHFSTVITPLDEVFEHRRGVCQDFAHFAIACLRGMGLSARYISGYLETLPPPGKPKLEGADASHAWLSVYVPGQGWFDFDPTNNQARTDQYITIAWGRDYGDVTPMKGVLYGGGEHHLNVAVDVKRLD